MNDSLKCPHCKKELNVRTKLPVCTSVKEAIDNYNVKKHIEWCRRNKKI